MRSECEAGGAIGVLVLTGFSHAGLRACRLCKSAQPLSRTHLRRTPLGRDCEKRWPRRRTLGPLCGSRYTRTLKIPVAPGWGRGGLILRKRSTPGWVHLSQQSLEAASCSPRAHHPHLRVQRYGSISSNLLSRRPSSVLGSCADRCWGLRTGEGLDRPG